MAKRRLSAPARKSKKNTKKQAQNPIWSLFKLGLVLCIWAGFALGLLTLWYAKDLPSIAKQADFERKTSITFLDRHGEIITRYGGLQGDYIAVFDLKPYTVHAILATEDRRFYSHFGIGKFLFLNFLCTPLPAPEYPDFESIIIFFKLTDFPLTNGISGKSIEVG